jgi:hypothetical protein
VARNLHHAARRLRRAPVFADPRGVLTPHDRYWRVCSHDEPSLHHPAQASSLCAARTAWDMIWGYYPAQSRVSPSTRRPRIVPFRIHSRQHAGSSKSDRGISRSVVQPRRRNQPRTPRWVTWRTGGFFPTVRAFAPGIGPVLLKRANEPREAINVAVVLSDCGVRTSVRC